MFRLVISIVATGLLAGLAGCGWRGQQRPSILLIAVEGLGFQRAACNTGSVEPTDGFERLCAESVRFTHAYTPSLMSQATLASILSARFPAEHGVWHNGAQFLSERIETVAEMALARGFRTSFFSGGPPVWSKSGIDQGFEIFEDNIPIDGRRLYRPVAENFNLFLRWLDRETTGEPFFAVIYLPDLQFASFPTETDLGETRSRTLESQVREVSESLNHFIDELKKRNRWDSTYVVLTGLNGMTNEARTDEITTTNLHSENAQVFLVVKPATKRRDESIEWSIDSNVTLVDLGATFYDLIGASEGAFFEREIAANSLVSAIERPSVTWPKDRFILSESAWAHWRGVGSTRYSLRQQHFFFLYDEIPRLYNTLIDRQEFSPLSTKDPLTHTWFRKFEDFFSQKKIPAFARLPEVSMEKIRLAQDIATATVADTEQRMEAYVKARPWEKQVLGWLARTYIKKQKWEKLETLGTEHLNPLWVYVARIKRGLPADPPQHICFSLLFDYSERTASGCKDDLFMSFYHWARAGGGGREAEERFVRRWIYAQIDEKISRLNYQNGLAWDTALDIPGEPTLVELALLLPNFEKYAAFVETLKRRVEPITGL